MIFIITQILTIFVFIILFKFTFEHVVIVLLLTVLLDIGIFIKKLNDVIKIFDKEK